MATNTLQIPRNPSRAKTNTALIFTTGVFGALLNQSDVLFGLNISLADFVIVILVALLINNNQFQLPLKPILAFMIFSAVVLINAVFIIPNLTRIPLSPLTVTLDYTKVLVSFLYFIVGFLIAKNALSKTLFKWFVIAAVAIGFLGIVFSLVPVPAMVNLLFYETVRLKGLMNDPNYFSVIQCAAIAVLLRWKPLNPMVKISAISLLVLSIFSSGSKTGFLTLAALVVFWMMNLVLEGNMEIKQLIKLLFVLFLVFLSLPYLQSVLELTLSMVSEKFPIFSRVELLLTDFGAAVSANGSGREEQWIIAMDLIKDFPLIGVGNTGNYLALVQEMSSVGNLAHNTYLQMAGEWGIPVTLFMTWYLVRIFFSPISANGTREVHITTKEMLFTFLVSSMSLSFNNSRVFWLLLGMAVWYTIQAKEKDGKSVDLSENWSTAEEFE